MLSKDDGLETGGGGDQKQVVVMVETGKEKTEHTYNFVYVCSDDLPNIKS